MVLQMLTAVQGVYASIYVHHIRGEVQGTRWSKASQVWCVRVFPSSQEMNEMREEVVGTNCERYGPLY